MSGKPLLACSSTHPENEHSRGFLCGNFSVVANGTKDTRVKLGSGRWHGLSGAIYSGMCKSAILVVTVLGYCSGKHYMWE